MAFSGLAFHYICAVAGSPLCKLAFGNGYKTKGRLKTFQTALGLLLEIERGIDSLFLIYKVMI